MSGVSLPFLSCDPRSLTVYRIALAAAVCHAAWTAAAAAPASVPDLPTGISGPALLLGAVRVATFAAGICLAFGYRTHLSTFAGWLLMSCLSLLAGPSNADAALCSGANTLLSGLLFLGLFLPLSSHYSIDEALDRSHSPEAQPGDAERRGEGGVPRLACAALVIYLAFAVVMISLRVLGQAPFDASVVWTLAAGLTALLPGRLWSEASALTERKREGLRVYFDEDCGFCRKTCYLLRTFLILGPASIQPAQINPAVHAVMQARNSWVVYDVDGRQYVRWDAVLLLMRRSPVCWPMGALLTALGMGRWGDPLYACIAHTRSTWSRVTKVLLPYRREHLPHGRWATVAISLWLVAAFVSHVLVAVGSAPPDTPIGRTLGLISYWPSPGACS